MSNKTPIKYSVIVPVYNAESTVRLCLDRFCCQLRDDVEILLINDGSKDASGEICREYAARYENFRYFEKENGGVSSARNLGLDNAVGKYILFVDSDDYISEDYFETIDTALKDDADMLIFGSREISDGSVINTADEISEFDPERTKRGLVMLTIKGCMNALWTRALKREIIEDKHIRFCNEIAIAEDTSFIFTYALYTSSYKTIPNVLYNVSTDNGESLSRKKRENLERSLYNACLNMYKAFNESDKKLNAELEKVLAYMYYRSVYSASKELLKYGFDKKQRRKKIRGICRLFSSKIIKPKDLKCFVIALPVRLKMSFSIDYLVRRKAKLTT